MAKVRTEEMFVCQFCGSLYEVGSKEDHTDFLNNHSCDLCEDRNLDAFEKYWDHPDRKEPEVFTTSTGFTFRRLCTGEYTDGDLTFDSLCDLLDFDSF